MPTLEQISPALVADFKAVRLRALREDPGAFGSTYAKESLLSDSDWLARVATWNGARSVCFLALEASTPCGIIASYFDKPDPTTGRADPTRAHVVSMWVAPEQRRTGLGSTLMNAVEAWARQLGATELCLMVTSYNTPAIRFYEGCGFAPTGATEPYPNDPEQTELEMAKALR